MEQNSKDLCIYGKNLTNKFSVQHSDVAQREGLPLTCFDPNDREDLLLEILKSGLPKPSKPTCGKSVVIVGAGISGLIGEFKGRIQMLII